MEICTRARSSSDKLLQGWVSKKLCQLHVIDGRITIFSNVINTKKLALFVTLQQLQKNRARPLPHSDFTLLIPLYDCHPTPAVLAFVYSPWFQATSYGNASRSRRTFSFAGYMFPSVTKDVATEKYIGCACFGAFGWHAFVFNAWKTGV